MIGFDVPHHVYAPIIGSDIVRTSKKNDFYLHTEIIGITAGVHGLPSSLEYSLMRKIMSYLKSLMLCYLTPGPK